MSECAEYLVREVSDRLQQRLTTFACDLDYDRIPREVIHAAKARVIDTLGVLISGFFAEPCRVSRNVAALMPNPGGATIIGTRMRTTPDMAAFVNSVTACYPAMTDSYHWPGGDQGHPSETVTPLLAVAEHARANGRDLIRAIVVAYEIFLRFSDAFHNPGFDNTNFGCLAIAAASAKLLGLSANQISNAISLAAVPNNILRQVRKDHLSMFKAVAPGQAGRSGVFAALLARAGMKAPHLPFEGKAGWLEHVARERFSLEALSANTSSFKILDTLIKNRPAEGKTISPILAAEKLAPLRDFQHVKQVIVETHRKAKENVGTGERFWNPTTRETADHSIPYVVAATLIDGTVTLHSFDDAHLWNPALRALMRKIEVVANDQFTRAYEQIPQEHRTRITVLTARGDTLVAESGGDKDDLSSPKSDLQFEEKFRALAEEVLGTKRASAILNQLWHLEEMNTVAEILPALVIV